MALSEKVTLVEVGPRDGLQNISRTLSVNTRIELINRLSETGLTYIEVGSFVSPQKVPQMSLSDKVLQQINKRSLCHYPVLTPNIRGLEDAINAGAKDIAVFGSASETFCQKNIGCSVNESIAIFSQVTEMALRHNISVRGYLSCVLGCPYEGEVCYKKTASLAKKMIDMGCYEISVGDTIGVGTPNQVIELLSEVSLLVPLSSIAVHFHDTYGQALANVYAALQEGISTIDASVAGLGGCPYAPGACGNVATEDVLYMINGLGINSGVDLNSIIQTSQFICSVLGCENRSRVTLAKNVQKD